MRASVVCAVLLLVLTGEALGLSANEEMPGCRVAVGSMHSGHPSGWGGGHCTGAIGAIFYFSEDLRICPPNGSSVGQAMRVVVPYIDSRPARLHENFYSLAAEALKAQLQHDIMAADQAYQRFVADMLT